MKTTPRRDHADEGFSLVELLIVLLLTTVLATATTSVIVSTTRTSTFTNDLRTVMDDGRISLDRVRNELREARRVLPSGTTASSVRFWIDRNQDGEIQPAELICYAVAEIGSTGTYELLRWSGATMDCDTPGSDARSIARTLVSNTGIFSYDPAPNADPYAPRTRLINVAFVLDARTGQGPDFIRVETTVRLRNVH